MSGSADIGLKYLNAELMNSIDTETFVSAEPYPWLNPSGMIKPDKLEILTAELPDISEFTPTFGYERKFGQTAHDRYALEYTAGLKLSPAWHEFIDELCGDSYRNFVRRLFDADRVKFSFQWHYTPKGASVSPHVDSRRKLGTQIFYMNSDADWNPEWGGQTLVLDDRGEFGRDSSPPVESFYACHEATIGSNRSLIFGRGQKSWHAVKALECPEDAYRKVFIVRYEKDRPVKRLRKRISRFLSGKPAVDPADRSVF
jgi:hypothetical protein